MSLKKKLAMSIATGALAVSMIGGGTYAYFSDVAISENNTFAAGTLDLAVNPTTIIKVNNLKPGDWINRTFKLENNGSLDISKVLLGTEYTESVEGFADQIVVEFLKNEDKSGKLGDSNVIESLTLSELKALSPDAVDNTSPTDGKEHPVKPEHPGKGKSIQFGEKDGLERRTHDNMHVRFKFKYEEDVNQNAFQGANLTLKWTFTALQTDGIEIK